VLIGRSPGLVVMLCAISGIWLLRSATVGLSGQSVWSAFSNGCDWLALDLAAGFGKISGDAPSFFLYRSDYSAGGRRC
jgi:hypothetical protein